MAVRRLLAYAAIYFLWGGSYLAIRQVVSVMPPFFAAGIRLFTAGVILYAYSRFQGIPQPSNRQWGVTALLGLAMFAVNYGCLFWSERFLPSGLAAVLTSLMPLWTLLAEWSIFRSVPMTARTLLGILLGVAGVFLLALPSGAHHGGWTKAALILVLGTVCWAGGTVASSRLDLPKQPTMSACLPMAWGGFFLLLLSGAAGEFPRLAGLSHLWDWRVAFSLAYLIVAASILAFTAYIWLIAREPATRVTSYAYVNPVIALVLGIALAQERPTALQYAGALLVLAGVFSTLTVKRTIKTASIETAA